MPPLSPFATPGAALAAQAAARGGAPALVFPDSGRALTYAGWHDGAARLAAALLAFGVARGHHVGLLAETRLEWPIVQLAVAMAGAVLVPFNTHYRREDLRHALAHSKVSALFLSESFRSNRYLETVAGLRRTLPYLETVICFDRAAPGCLSLDEFTAAARTGGARLPDIDADATASLQYTSGTTGLPKGALLTHRGMMGNSWGISGRLGVSESDRWTSIIPLFHCAGCIMCILGVLQRGACYVGVPSFDPERMFRVIEDERCTMLSGVPTSFLAMLEHPARAAHDLSSLRAGTCGGADTDPALLARCADAFPLPGLVQVYGQTEASTLIGLADHEAPGRFATCGPPLPGAEVRIVDPATGAALPTREIGEIQTRGEMVMLGYFGNDEATRETIGEDGWMRTGDLGLLTADGDLVIAGGRLRDMIIRGGENVYPAEVETALRGHDAVADAAVFGLPDRYYGEIVAAAVTVAGPVSAGALARHCADRIARFKVPARFFRVDRFPSTASGKVRKAALREEATAGGLPPL